MTHRNIKKSSLAAIVLLGLGVSPASHAQTTLFSDNFGTNAQTNVTNGTTDAGRISGSLYNPATFAYVNNASDTPGAIAVTGTPVINSGTLVIGAGANGVTNAGYASPNFSFGTGNNVTFSIDILAAETDGSAVSNTDNNWAGLFFGNSTNTNLVHSNVNTIDGIGLIFRNTNGYLLFNNSGSSGTPTGTSYGTPGTVTNIKVNLNDTVLSAPVMTVFVNNSSTPLFTYTRSTPLLGGYAGLTISNSGGTNDTWGFDNFVVTATPEPSQTAALGLGVLGLAALAFKARRRASQTA